jgi:hypothetical protein
MGMEIKSIDDSFNEIIQSPLKTSQKRTDEIGVARLPPLNMNKKTKLINKFDVTFYVMEAHRIELPRKHCQ